MTLEEAKKKIRNYMKQSKDDYNRFEDDICRGEADAYSHALSILEQVDTEPVVKDKLTLTELAQELKKTIAFDYMTMHKNWCKEPIILLYVGKPRYSRGGDIGGWCPVPGKSHVICSINVYSVIGGIQLLEYADRDGNIDYSRCIVEVKE